MMSYTRLSIADFIAECKKGHNVLENISVFGVPTCITETISDINLEGAYLKNCYFTRISFQNFRLKNAIFENVILESSSVKCSELDLTKFENCKMLGTLFVANSMINSDLSSLNNNSNSNSNFPLYLRECNLKGALFNYSNLEECKIELCNLEEASFKHAMLKHMILYRNTIQNADFTNAKNITLEQLRHANICPKRDDKYIGGISYENAEKLLNLALRNSELEQLIKLGPGLNTYTSLLGFWAYLAASKHFYSLKNIRKLDFSEIPSERELMLDVLKNDLKVKGLETLGLF